MKKKWFGLVLFVVLSGWFTSACQQKPTEVPPLPAPTVTPAVSEPTATTPVVVEPTPTLTVSAAEPSATPAEGGAEAPEPVVAARDVVLAFVRDHYLEQAPAAGLSWTERRMTPQGLLGAETFQYTADGWVLTISYPVVHPDLTIYRVLLANEATGFQWEGEVDAEGQVTEVAGLPADPVLAARDASLSYLGEQYDTETPAADLTWTRTRITPEELVGAETFEYRAGHWRVTVSYPVVAPDQVVYKVVVSNQSTGFQWEGEVDAAGDVTEVHAPISGQPVVGWYGQVTGLPTAAQYDDYLALQPEGTGELGVTGADATMDREIERLRDSGTFAHFWGTLALDAPDHNGYQLTVTRLRIDEPGPLCEPDPIEAWEGTIASTPEGAQYDDYFVLADEFPVRFGIASSDPALAAQLEGLRDTGSTVRVWGRLTCGVIDVNGSQISVIAIAVVGEPAAQATNVVDGWTGMIKPLPAGSEYDDCFERNDGQRYGIDSTDEDMQTRIVALRTTASRVRIWGRLLVDVADVENRRIQLESYELATEGEEVDGWTGTIIKLETGAQYDDYFERADGERYGIETSDPKLARRLEVLRDQGVKVQVWGELVSNVLDVESRQIRVTEIAEVE